MILNTSGNKRNGVAILAFVAALLVIGSYALWLFQLTAATASSSLAFYYGTGAFYAAESGLEMALMELNASPANDFDSDGQIGTISDNGDATDDPELSVGRFSVVETSTSPLILRAEGRSVQTVAPWSEFKRVLETYIE